MVKSSEIKSVGEANLPFHPAVAGDHVYLSQETARKIPKWSFRMSAIKYCKLSSIVCITGTF